MSPDGTGLPRHVRRMNRHLGTTERDPYLVSLVNASNGQHSENVEAVLDELGGTASRRRVQLLTTN
jgi:hypothetical protein